MLVHLNADKYFADDFDFQEFVDQLHSLHKKSDKKDIQSVVCWQFYEHHGNFKILRELKAWDPNYASIRAKGTHRNEQSYTDENIW